MSLFRRLAGFVCLLALLAGAVLWITRESRRPRESNQERGLRWLRDEYHLDDAAFQKAVALHQAYFATCDQMCQEVKAATRPLLMRPRHLSGNLTVMREHEQKLCDKCETAARQHLQQVAQLMTPEQSQRFLNDMLPTLEEQRQQHDLETSPRPRR